MLKNVAVLLLDEVHPFELGVLCEVFGLDRSAGRGTCRSTTSRSSPPRRRSSRPMPASPSVPPTASTGWRRPTSSPSRPSSHVAGTGVPGRSPVGAAAGRGARGAGVERLFRGVRPRGGGPARPRAPLHDALAARGRQLARRYPKAIVEPDVLYVDEGPRPIHLGQDRRRERRQPPSGAPGVRAGRGRRHRTSCGAAATGLAAGRSTAANRPRKRGATVGSTLAWDGAPPGPGRCPWSNWRRWRTCRRAPPRPPLPAGDRDDSVPLAAAAAGAAGPASAGDLRPDDRHDRRADGLRHGGDPAPPVRPHARDDAERLPPYLPKIGVQVPDVA
ncbi:hypothetical protein SMICM304S_06421 [Streptomyces microflavus]